MIIKGEVINKEFRFFENEYSRANFKLLKKWSKLPSVQKRVTAGIHQGNFVRCFKACNTDKKISLSFYELVPRVTFNSEFIQCKIIWSVYYSKDTKRLYINNVRNFKDFFSYTGSRKYLLETLGMEAFLEGSSYDNQEGKGLILGNFLNKVNVKAIVTGNCTNLNNLVGRYFNSIGIKNMNLHRVTEYSSYFGNMNTTYQALRAAKNLENLFTYIKETKEIPTDRKDSNLISDSINMALQLNLKLDFKWSKKRFKTEHDKMIKLISKVKLEAADTTPVSYRDVAIPEVSGVSILRSSFDLVEESLLLNHCVGTSSVYLDKIKKYQALIIKYDKLGFRGTAEVAISSKKEPFSISQFRGYKDKMAPDECFTDLKELLGNPFQSFIEGVRTYNTNNIPESEGGPLEIMTYPFNDGENPY